MDNMDDFDKEDRDKEDGINLAGFLFGNIDERGELEDSDILDDESKKHLSQLASLGALGPLVEDISSENQQEEGSSGSNQDGYIKSAETAVDYSNIDELADEENEKYLRIGLQTAAGPSSRPDEDDYDDDYCEPKKPGIKNLPRVPLFSEKRKASTPENAMGLPSVVPSAETAASEAERHERETLSDMFSPSSPRDFEHSNETVNRANIINGSGAPDGGSMQFEKAIGEKLDDDKAVFDGIIEKTDLTTVMEMFPDFRPGKVLRFSRLFGPKKYTSAQWKGLKKRRKKKRIHSSDGETKLSDRGFRCKTPPLPKPEECEIDDAVRMIEDIPIELYAPSHMIQKQQLKEVGKDTTEKQNVSCEWRYGPASYWYDRYNVPDDCADFDYGFKLGGEKVEGEGQEGVSSRDCDAGMPPDDVFNMIVQAPWEEDIVWSSDEYKPSKKSAVAQSSAGWVPSGSIRTLQGYLANTYRKADKMSSQALASAAILKNFSSDADILVGKTLPSKEFSNWYSIFPVENKELIYGKWENKIIWDDQSMPRIPSPTLFRLDPNDENLILTIPSEPSPETSSSDIDSTPKKDAKNKSRSGNKQKSDEEKNFQVSNDLRKDMFNLSNDEYYMPKQDQVENPLQIDLSNLTIQHSTPALELRRPFFPTYLSPNDLRHFHRPHYHKKKPGNNEKSGLQIVESLVGNIRKRAKEREKERQAFGGGEMFFMRTPGDLTGRDSEIILAEYCEEWPPLISQVGMNSRLRNYYRRKHGKDPGTPHFEYGETVYVQTSPFLGQLAPGQMLQAIENNMYRAPAYKHSMKPTDFLVIFSNGNYFVRSVQTIFTVGQECPKCEVPGPNSKRANNHMRDFLQIFIYRLFWKSPDNPRRIKMEDIKKAFPKHSESSVRKRLKLCADFRRTGADCNWWVLKKDFRLPTEDEMRALVTPEQTCSYLSMLAAEQRLKDAGYGEKSFFAPDEEENENDARKIDDEVQTAPWNTTRAFIQATKGKCLLQVNGVADPTGCGEGFSYIRVANKPPSGAAKLVVARDMITRLKVTRSEVDEVDFILLRDENKETTQKPMKQKLVTGTDADLRRLNLKNARNLLRDFGVSEEEINSLSRWEVINKVRTMSTEAARAGEEGGMSKFARGSRFTIAEHQEKYKEECQRIFDLQNRVLSSDVVLSTDEESSSEEASDLDELGKDLESMLSNKKNKQELSHESEEAERKELQKMLSQDRADKEKPSFSRALSGASSLLNKKQLQDDDDTNSVLSMDSSMPGRRLLIHRTFNEGGQQYSRTEVVKNQAVIDSYLRIVTRDKNYRQVFASQDEIHKENMRRERRRIQEQLRRIKRNEEKEKVRESKKVMKTPSDKPLKNLKCGACGGIGHMKTNKMCPKYQEGGSSSLQTSRIEDETINEELSNFATEDIIKVEGTKITLGKALLEAAEDMKRKALMIRIPKDAGKKKRRASSAAVHPDYLMRHHMSKNRRRTNPLVALSLIFEGIISRMKEVPESWPFHTPVSTKAVPDYYQIVKQGMDLQTLREEVKNGRYHTKDAFLEHVTLIYSNCVLYNGMSHQLTKVAEEVLTTANKLLAEKEGEILVLEKEINPLLDGNAQIGFSFILESIVQQLKAIPDSWPFHIPVSSKIVQDYYEIVKNPMDLETMKNNCQEHRYHSRDAFLDDVKLIYNNSLLYNGPDHAFTQTAQKMVESCESLISMHSEQFGQMELEMSLEVESMAQREDFGVDSPSIGFPKSFKKRGSSMMAVRFTDSKQVIMKGDEEDEDVDIEGMDSFGSVHHSYTESRDDKSEETMKQLLLEDLQHSEGSDDEEEDEESDFMFDDGDEDDFEMEDDDVDLSAANHGLGYENSKHADADADDEEIDEDDDYP